MKYQVTHVTRYDYSEPVSLCHNLAHLKPRSYPGQNCFASQIQVEPMPAVSREFRDFFGNQVNYFSIQQAHRQLTVVAISEVEVSPRPLADEASALVSWESVCDAMRDGSKETVEARIYCLDSPFVHRAPALAAYAGPSFTPGRSLLEAVRELSGRIFTEFTYDPDFSEVATPLGEVMEHRRGVCQDFAHLAIGCLRSIGLPARYVSGYLETLPPPGKARLRGSDASHAWFSVFLPGEGWMDFDPTNDKVPEEQHVTTAVGRDFGDVTPVKGVLYGGGEHELYVSVDVERLDG